MVLLSFRYEGEESMQGKRSDGEGSIVAVKDTDGKITGYRGAIRDGFKPDGTPNRRYVRGKTRKAVADKLKTPSERPPESHRRELVAIEGQHGEMTLADLSAKWFQ